MERSGDGKNKKQSCTEIIELQTKDMKVVEGIEPSAIAGLKKIGGSNLVKKMILAFHKNVPNRILSAYEGAKNREIEDIERAAHSIKSSAGNLGAVQMQGLSENLEQIAGRKENADYQALISELEKSYYTFKLDLDQFMEEDIS